MPFEIPAYASQGPADKFKPFRILRRDLQPNDVRIDIKYTGVCGTDLHQTRNDWGRTSYPIVPGHEIVGTVSEVGSKVTKFRVGDAVAVGCTVDSCGRCADCCDSQEQNCLKGRVSTYNSPDPHFDGHQQTYGGYSTQILVQEHFVLRVPDALLKNGRVVAGAAPIACAGVTTWAPLRRFGAGPSKSVGIVGLGGLGHMAVKLAVALGSSNVSVFTHSPEKTTSAYQLGAHYVINTLNAEELASAARSLDLVLDTIPWEHDIGPYLNVLRPNGALVMLGYFGPLSKSNLASPQIIFGNKILTGSFIGGQQETQDVYDFCAEHGIAADVEIIPMSQINEAFENMQNGKVRFRYVIDSENPDSGKQ